MASLVLDSPSQQTQTISEGRDSYRLQDNPAAEYDWDAFASKILKEHAKGTIVYPDSVEEKAFLDFAESQFAHSDDKTGSHAGKQHTPDHQKDDTPAEDGSSQMQSRLMKFAVDFAYTLNHSIVCTLTDPITDVPITATTASIWNKLGKNNAEPLSASDVLNQLHPRQIFNTLKEETFSLKKDEGMRFNRITSFFLSEVAGDFGAVPVVVGLQHFAPDFMSALGEAVRPIAEPIFKRAAERRVKAEFALAGMGTDTPEFEERVRKIYEHELKQLPQAIMWTVASPTINIFLQKTLLGNKEDSVTSLLVGKALGAAITSALTVSLRAIAPDKAQKWDDWSSEKTGKPVARLIAKIFGVDEHELEEGMKQKHAQEHGKSWSKKIHENDAFSDMQR